MWGLGNASVKGKWGKKTYEMQVTTLQAITILAFNQQEAGERFRFDQLKERLNLPDEHLKRVLHSLSCGTSCVCAR